MICERCGNERPHCGPLRDDVGRQWQRVCAPCKVQLTLSPTFMIRAQRWMDSALRRHAPVYKVSVTLPGRAPVLIEGTFLDPAGAQGEACYRVRNGGTAELIEVLNGVASTVRILDENGWRDPDV